MRIAFGSDHRGGKIACAIFTEVLFPENGTGFQALEKAGCPIQENNGNSSLVGAFMISGSKTDDDHAFTGRFIENLLPGLAEETVGDKPMMTRVDYPDIAAAVADKVSAGEADLGILVCATGIGMCIVANKFFGIRAATCYNEQAAELSRHHNNSNILCVPGEIVGAAAAVALVRKWLTTGYDGGRHQVRLDKITEIEKKTGL